MSRSINTKFAPPAQTYIDNFHADIVTEICKTVSEKDVVVICGRSALSNLYDFIFLSCALVNFDLRPALSGLS